MNMCAVYRFHSKGHQRTGTLEVRNAPKVPTRRDGTTDVRQPFAAHMAAAVVGPVGTAITHLAHFPGQLSVVAVLSMLVAMSSKKGRDQARVVPPTFALLARRVSRRENPSSLPAPRMRPRWMPIWSRQNRNSAGALETTNRMFPLAPARPQRQHQRKSSPFSSHSSSSTFTDVLPFEVVKESAIQWHSDLSYKHVSMDRCGEPVCSPTTAKKSDSRMAAMPSPGATRGFKSHGAAVARITVSSVMTGMPAEKQQVERLSPAKGSNYSCQEELVLNLVLTADGEQSMSHRVRLALIMLLPSISTVCKIHEKGVYLRQECPERLLPGCRCSRSRRTQPARWRPLSPGLLAAAWQERRRPSPHQPSPHLHAIWNWFPSHHLQHGVWAAHHEPS